MVGMSGNYKEMCRKLKEPEKYGNSKDSQIKRWESQFKIKKETSQSGRVLKYTIVDVYSKPKQIPSKAGQRHSFYQDGIECALCYYLKIRFGSDEHQADFWTTELFQIAGLVKKDYCDLKNSPNYEDKAYYNLSYPTVKNALESALKDLTKKGMPYTYVWKVKDENGVLRDATSKEISDYSSLQQDLLKEFGDSSLQEVFWKQQAKKFYEELRKRCEATGVKCTYKQTRIYYNESLLKMATDRITARTAVRNFNGKLADNLEHSKVLQTQLLRKVEGEDGKNELVPYIMDNTTRTLEINKHTRITSKDEYPLPLRFDKNEKVVRIEANEDGSRTYVLKNKKGRSRNVTLEYKEIETYGCCLDSDGNIEIVSTSKENNGW